MTTARHLTLKFHALESPKVTFLDAGETRTERQAIEAPRRSVADFEALAANITRFAAQLGVLPGGAGSPARRPGMPGPRPYALLGRRPHSVDVLALWVQQAGLGFRSPVRPLADGRGGLFWALLL